MSEQPDNQVTRIDNAHTPGGAKLVFGLPDGTNVQLEAVPYRKVRVIVDHSRVCAATITGTTWGSGTVTVTDVALEQPVPIETTTGESAWPEFERKLAHALAGDTTHLWNNAGTDHAMAWVLREEEDGAHSAPHTYRPVAGLKQTRIRFEGADALRVLLGYSPVGDGQEEAREAFDEQPKSTERPDWFTTDINCELNLATITLDAMAVNTSARAAGALTPSDREMLNAIAEQHEASRAAILTVIRNLGGILPGEAS